MRVSEYVGQWVEKELDKQTRDGEQVWYDVTMAPTGGGPNGDTPFLAVLLTMKSPLADQSLHISHFFTDFISLDEEGVQLFVTEGMMQLREARSLAMGTVQLKNEGTSPGRLFLPKDHQ